MIMKQQVTRYLEFVLKAILFQTYQVIISEGLTDSPKIRIIDTGLYSAYISRNGNLRVHLRIIITTGGQTILHAIRRFAA